MNEEGTPLSTVLESARDTRNVMSTPSTITPVSSAAEAIDRPAPPPVPIKNMVIIAMRVGNAHP